MSVTLSPAEMVRIGRRQSQRDFAVSFCLGRAEAAHAAGRHDRAAAWLGSAARLADHYGSPFLALPRLEQLAVKLAATIAEAAPVPVTTPRRWLHVATAVGTIGGHSRLIQHWIESDHSGDVHHLAVTGQRRLRIDALRAAVERSGGTVTVLGGTTRHRARAARLRALAQGAAGVVNHANASDIVPSLAFGVDGGPPVLQVDHVDHAFWAGASITDLLVSLRPVSAVLAERHRGIARQFLLPIPLPAPADPGGRAAERVAMRVELDIPRDAPVFLTVGRAEKYRALGDLDFLAMARQLLTALPEAYLVAVGPGPFLPGWHEAIVALSPRLVALGPRPSAAPYHAAADIYLEGFPFDSATALLEAALFGLPVVPVPALAPLPFSAHDLPLSAIPQPADLDAYVADAIALARSEDARRARAARLSPEVARLHTGAGWTARLGALQDALPLAHRVTPVRPSRIDPALDDFWTAYRLQQNPEGPFRYGLMLLAARLRARLRR